MALWSKVLLSHRCQYFTILLKLWCDFSKFLRCSTSSTSKESIDFLFPLTRYSELWLLHKNVIFRIMKNAVIARANCKVFLLLNRILRKSFYSMQHFNSIHSIVPCHSLTVLTFTNHKVVFENSISSNTSHEEILIETVLTLLTFTNYTFGSFNGLWRRWK